MFHPNCFIYGATQSFGDTAIAYSLIAARWAVIGWDWYAEAFFSARAKARYEWMGQLLGCMMALAYLYPKGWVDAQVAAAVEEAPDVEIAPVIPLRPPVPAIAATSAAPVAVSVVKVEAPATELPWLMTSQELRKECQRRAIVWRNAHGKGKHLRKEEMVKALA